TILGSSQPPSHSYFCKESLSGYKTGEGCLVKWKPSVLHANPILEVPANFPILSSALYKRKTVSFRTMAAGLKTSFSSHFNFSFLTGQKNSVVESGTRIGFTSSDFTNGKRAQFSVLSPALSCDELHEKKQRIIKIIMPERMGLKFFIFIKRINGRAGLHFKHRFDDPILQSIYPAMKIGSPFFFPTPLNDSCLCQVVHLLLDI